MPGAAPRGEKTNREKAHREKAHREKAHREKAHREKAHLAVRARSSPRSMQARVAFATGRPSRHGRNS